jgi:hypothetical protein
MQIVQSPTLSSATSSTPSSVPSTTPSSSRTSTDLPSKNMPGRDFHTSNGAAVETVQVPPAQLPLPSVAPSPQPEASVNGSVTEQAVYYNPRLDPKNFLEGPLSANPATRLRQMLARPGIVVSMFKLSLDLN